jgi:hypothetical protein
MWYWTCFCVVWRRIENWLHEYIHPRYERNYYLMPSCCGLSQYTMHFCTLYICTIQSMKTVHCKALLMDTAASITRTGISLVMMAELKSARTGRLRATCYSHCFEGQSTSVIIISINGCGYRRHTKAVTRASKMEFFFLGPRKANLIQYWPRKSMIDIS